MSIRKKSNRYLKIVEWSKKDGCYIGTSPGLIVGGVHGQDQRKVFTELCQAVEEAIHLLEKEGRPLPEATANKKYSGKVLLRIPPALHRILVIKALKEGTSINKMLQHRLEAAF
ncbi:MAG: toxin-antitoxin system HicB family antitoxin [Deltaproteobacteria bacterium]|nr:toxin-antitoxin system HicB family antitoxin [Deltaproteobacteria bacterium]MBI4374494.1 toxin-antitoxin system HicB family antitoxin [Deltaproteobacteria bacterium]